MSTPLNKSILEKTAENENETAGICNKKLYEKQESHNSFSWNAPSWPRVVWLPTPLFQLVLTPIFLFSFPCPPYFLFWPLSLYRAILVNHLAQLILLSIELFPIFFFPKLHQLHYFNHHHGKVVTSLPHVSCMQLTCGSHPPLPFIEMPSSSRVGSKWWEKTFGPQEGSILRFFFNIYCHFQNK